MVPFIGLFIVAIYVRGIITSAMMIQAVSLPIFSIKLLILLLPILITVAYQ